MTRPCPDCGANPGELYLPGCDVERHPRCGCQLISCDCIYEVCGIKLSTLEETHPDIYRGGPTEAMYATWDAEWGKRRMRWTGEGPGAAECREHGWYSKWIQNTGWVQCPAEDPDASENLNRLHEEARWDAERQRRVRRS